MITCFRLKGDWTEGDVGACYSLPCIYLRKCAPDPCTLGQDRPYREPTVGERATIFLHPLLFGHFLHQWQRILVHLVLLLRGACASVGCCKAERSSSTRVSRSHKGRIDCNAPSQLCAANHDLLEAHLLLSILLKA